MEEWRDIKNFEGLYQVSDKGRVRSLWHAANGKKYAGRILPGMVIAGYPAVRLGDGPKKYCIRIQRLVAEAFLENPQGLPEVSNKDGNRSNNSVGNLEWCASKENKIHALASGFAKELPGEGPKAVGQYDGNVLIAIYKSADIASLLLGIDNGSICKCCMGKRNTAGGYVWKYKNEEKFNEDSSGKFGMP